MPGRILTAGRAFAFELQIDLARYVHWLDKGGRNSGEWAGTSRETIGK
jgi:hypothetical protein